MTTDALHKALADSERSYLASKAAVADISSDLLARGPTGSLSQRTDMTRAGEQLKHFTSWVFAAVRLVATRVAGQPIRVGVVRGRRARMNSAKQAIPSNVQAIEGHPILDCLADPNDLMTAWALIYSTVASLELTGQALWWLPMQGGRRRIYPIPSSWIESVEGSINFQRWLIRPPNHAGDPLPIDADEAMYASYPHPADPRLPFSPLQAAGAAVDADASIISSQRAMFGRGIHPSHAIIIGEEGEASKRPRLTAAQQEQIIRPIRQRYAGTTRHGEPIILDALIRDIKTLSNSVKEMDYLASGKDIKERILQAFGVSPILLGQVEGANRASAAVADEIFCANKVNPLIRLLSETMTEWLTPLFSDGGEKLAVWIEPAAAKNDELMLKKWQLLVQAGVADVNEMRAAFGFKRIDIGDRFIKAVDRLMTGPVRHTKPAVPSGNGRFSHECCS